MDTKLTALYEGMLKKTFSNEEIVTEGEGTVATKKVTPSSGKPADLEGADKAKGSSMSKDSGPSANTKVPTPTKGPSDDDTKGKPEVLAGSKGTKKDSEDVTLSFDQLFKQVIKEEDEVVDAPSIEGEEFNDDNGDFGEGEEGLDETEEEVDLATELRMLAGRLNEIADKLSTGDEELESEESVTADEALGGEGEGLGEPEGMPALESVQNNLKPAKKTTLNPKMSQNPKASGYTKKSGAGKAQTPAAKTRDGSLSPLSASKGKSLQSGMTVSGKGPAHKGGNDAFIQ